MTRSRGLRSLAVIFHACIGLFCRPTRQVPLRRSRTAQRIGPLGIAEIVPESSEAMGRLVGMDAPPTARVRPVAVPDDLGESAPVAGMVELPLSIRWSGSSIEFDMSNPRHLCSVYEQVLREGTEADVRRYVRASVLAEVWDELFLPVYVRDAWTDWFARRRAA